MGDRHWHEVTREEVQANKRKVLQMFVEARDNSYGEVRREMDEAIWRFWHMWGYLILDMELPANIGDVVIED